MNTSRRRKTHTYWCTYIVQDARGTERQINTEQPPHTQWWLECGNNVSDSLEPANESLHTINLLISAATWTFYLSLSTPRENLQYFYPILVHKSVHTMLTSAKTKQNYKLGISLWYLQIALSGWLTGHYNFRCQPVDYSNSPRTLRVRGYVVTIKKQNRHTKTVLKNLDCSSNHPQHTNCLILYSLN